MNLKEQQKQATAFVKRWQNRGNERQDSQSFWLDLLQSVYGIENPASYITFENNVLLDHNSYIDGFIDATKVLIEQKGKNKDLSKAIRQSDGSFLTAFQQAKRYSDNLQYSKKPRWIVTCNFNEFYVYDMERPNSEASIIKLADLPKETYRLEFLIDKTNEHVERSLKISMQAGEIVKEIYNALLKQYRNPDNPDSLHSLNQLVVRLVFCFYAEDAGLFGKKLMFHDYLAPFSSKHFRSALIELFKILDTPIDERDPYLDDDLARFPYVNGGLFAESNIEIPNFDDNLKKLILEHASSSFDWSDISPTIFGALFESTLNPEKRRSGGMHYTSIENIHKVIDPLFLNELQAELDEIKLLKQPKTIDKKARAFQEKLASLTFFDPACGSGNFLTETYLSLRRLENEAIKLYAGYEQLLDVELVKVKLNQFYGIEINDFAVSVAKTALWIAESQMLEETNKFFTSDIVFLPLKSYTHIVEGNALTTDWEQVVPKHQLSYIIGNPPFVGANNVSKIQKAELRNIFGDNSNAGIADYVCGWYVKAAQLIANTPIRCAFVSTNSITQGEQVAVLWTKLLEYDISIQFAYTSFVWNSEANEKAAVHCVIIGFGIQSEIVVQPILFDSSNNKELVSKISPYLIEGKMSFVGRQNKPICDVPIITKGCQPTDGGNLILDPNELTNLLKLEPKAEKYIKKLVGSKEFINNTIRYCLWLVGISPKELRSMPRVLERVEKVREMRLSSSAKGTQKLAERPHEFRETYNYSSYIIVPSASSENRRYIPLGFLDENTISTNANLIIPNANLYHFGILTSNIHMAWMRTVAGRLKSDYRYSAKVVYNNFPWPNVTTEQKAKIEQTAQAILDARALYSDSSLADLYDELTMPVELRKAHQANDRAVMEAYKMTKVVNGKKTWLSESETVAQLFEMYEKLTKNLTS